MDPTVPFVAIYAVAVALGGGGAVQLWQFLAATPRIDDARALERFKDMARVQMYLALAVIGLLGTGMLVGFGVLARHGLRGLLAVLGANGVVLVTGMAGRRLEVRARSLPVADTLAAEYRRVGETWVRKPLPDF